MDPSDHPPLVAIAMLAAAADGSNAATEQSAIDEAAARIGTPDVARLARQLASGQVNLAELAGQLSDDEARRTAYTTALAVCHADGPLNAAEQQFLEQLRSALGLDPAAVAELGATAGALAAVPVALPAPPAAPPQGPPLDDLILQQAILTGALAILPNGLAGIAILPLQMRLVYQIGQRHGQRLDVNQVKDLAATLGIGVAAQAMEGAVVRFVGGLAGGLLGGLIGGVTRIATGAAVTFASTYALGYVAEQYYAQGRQLSAADLQGLFGWFQDEARKVYPRVQQQIQLQARTLSVPRLLAALRGP
jgi:uncharacterized membrane protein YebE (DUF533 family)